MKKKLIGLSVAFGITMMLPCMVNAAESGTCGDNLNWTLDDSGTLTISGSGDLSFETPPPWIYDYKEINSVILEEGITSLGDGVFGDYNITNVTIPNSVTNIGEQAFVNTLLKSVTIPNSVIDIGGAAFAQCYDLEEIVLSDNLTILSNNLFSGCSALKNINIPNSVTYIDYNVFGGCSSLANIMIPENVERIDYYAFRNCLNLKNVVISNNLKDIASDAFEGCSQLTDVYYMGSKNDWLISTKYENIDDPNLLAATIHYNTILTNDRLVENVSVAQTKYISEDDRATAFTAGLTNISGTEQSIRNVTWIVTPENANAVEIPCELPTMVTLETGAGSTIGLVIDGLYDENAAAKVEI